MPEDLTQQSTATVTPATAEKTPAAAPGATPAAEAALDLSILDKIPPDELVRHPRVAGILGDRVQRKLVEQQQQIEARQVETAAAAERERLKRLRREDPVAYAEVMDTVEAQQEREREMAGLHAKTRDEFARNIGRAATSLPEWSELTADDLGEIASSLAGKSDEEALGVYTQAVIKKLASRMVAKQLQTEVDKRLTQEKKAWRTEWEADRLSGEPKPDLTKPRGRPSKGVDLASIEDDREFNKQYEKHVLGKT